MRNRGYGLAAIRSIVWLSIFGITPVFAGGVAILDTVLTDNGDNDGFSDTRETVSLRLHVMNTSGMDLTGVTARLVPVDPVSACVTAPEISIGDLAAGEVKLTDEAFQFILGDVDRTALGLTVSDPLSTSFRIQIFSQPQYQLAYPAEITLDLDLDVAGGSGPTQFFESFEDTLGAFEIDNINADLDSYEAADGYRCQYVNPDWPNSNNYGFGVEDQCFPANSPLLADQVYWGLSGPSHSPLGGRGFSGFHSLFFGVDLGPPNNWTTPVNLLEAVRTAQPIHLGWDGVTPSLAIMHQVSFTDSRLSNNPEGTAADHGVVMAQVANGAGAGVGPWFKLHPNQNVHDETDHPSFFNCSFDPIDDGNTEDDFFDPTDPNRKYGPSTLCYPEMTFAHLGETESAFNPQNLGHADGPGEQGIWGIGTWVRSEFDLSRFRGRSIRLRFLTTSIQIGGAPSETWEDVYSWNPDPGDDGWWIDDVTVTGALSSPALVAIDVADNSGLPGPAGGDADFDGFVDVCDNCASVSNPGQDDVDYDGIGDLCDICPGDPTNHDPDDDLVCGLADNCPFEANGDQIDGDTDGTGLACDCDDADATIHPGAQEINDGKDNQCAGDAGYGLTDEIGADTGFYDPTNKNKYSWTAQPGALRYRVARAGSSDFAVGCTLSGPTPNTFYVDSAQPVSGETFYYLVRAVLPNLGSWGAESSGAERTFSCN